MGVGRERRGKSIRACGSSLIYLYFIGCIGATLMTKTVQVSGALTASLASWFALGAGGSRSFGTRRGF